MLTSLINFHFLSYSLSFYALFLLFICFFYCRMSSVKVALICKCFMFSKSSPVFILLGRDNCFLYVFVCLFAEPPCSATRKRWWCVGIARPCCVSQLVVVPGLQKAAHSGERVTDLLVFVIHSLFAFLDWSKDRIRVWFLRAGFCFN